VFKNKTTKLNSQLVQYEKNKIAKTILEKKTKKIIKKNYVGKHYSNPQCFFKKTSKLNSQSAPY
jgi:type II secretory pathway component PulC